MIKILICDDQEIARQGLSMILGSVADLTVLGVASNGEEAVRLVESLHPDVVLMDLKMPVMNGAQATRIIRQRFPAIQVLVLTTYDDDEWLFDAIRAGASGYLLKDTHPPTCWLRSAMWRRASHPSIRPWPAEFSNP